MASAVTIAPRLQIGERAVIELEEIARVDDGRSIRGEDLPIGAIVQDFAAQQTALRSCRQ
jgi:hypothetical protein